MERLTPRTQKQQQETINLLHAHFLEFQSRTHKGSQRFMTKFWALACRWKVIMGRPGYKSELDAQIEADFDENKSELFDAFMSQVERWQFKFRQILLDDKGNQVQDQMVTTLIDTWKIDVAQSAPHLTTGGGLKLVTEPDNSKASQVDHWVKEMYLRRLNAYWMLLDHEKVCTVINFLGAESVRFIRCLAITVTAQHLETYVDLFDRVANRRYQFLGRPVACAEATFDAICTDEGETDEELELQVWDALAPDNPAGQQWAYERHLFPVPQQVEIDFHWCGIKGLLTHSKIQVISALSLCDEKSGMFKPIVSRALFQHHWDYCHNFFMLDRVLDVVSLNCLFLIVFMAKATDCSTPPDPGDARDCLNADARAHNDSRVNILILLVAFINIFNLFQIVCEGCVAFNRGVRSWFTINNFFLISGEIYQLRLLWSLLGVFSMMGDEQQNVTATPGHHRIPQTIFTETSKTRPILFCALILFKWGQFLLGYLVFDIGKTVLPAIYAMKSSDSVKFVIYMVMAILACTHAYWVIPLAPDDYEASGKFGSAYVSFFRMFRLCVMGDFDIWEIEGIDGAVDNPGINGIGGTGYVDEPPSDWTNTTAGLGKTYYFHEDIRVIIMAFGTVLTIMLMNMYIGVLSLAYEEFLAVKLEVFSHAKSKFMLRYLLRRDAIRKVLKPIVGAERLDDDTLPRILQIEEENPQGLMMELLNDGDVNPDPPNEVAPQPAGWVENALVGREHWIGFWTTVPQNLMPTEGTEVTYQNMEDNQGHMVDKLSDIEATVAGISDMVDLLLQQR